MIYDILALGSELATCNYLSFDLHGTMHRWDWRFETFGFAMILISQFFIKIFYI